MKRERNADETRMKRERNADETRMKRERNADETGMNLKSKEQKQLKRTITEK